MASCHAVFVQVQLLMSKRNRDETEYSTERPTKLRRSEDEGDSGNKPSSYIEEEEGSGNWNTQELLLKVQSNPNDLLTWVKLVEKTGGSDGSMAPY